MARKTGKELEELKKKYGVSEIWSWSRFSCYKTSPFEFYLKYILKEPEDNEPSIYGVFGGLVHEIIERFYLGEIKYEDMIKEYEDVLFELQVQGLKYNKVDEEANLKIGNKYEKCVEHFFRNHKPFKEKMYIEKFVDIKVGKYLFQSYLDAVCKIGDKVHILDWKTSTEYTGDKALKEIGQLKLYAYGLWKKGVKAEDIVYGWVFVKYYTFKFKQKNGKFKSMNIERIIDPMEVKTIKSNILGKLEEFGYNKDEFIDYKFEELPENIKSEYEVSDCMTLFNSTEQELEDFAKEVEKNVDEICDRIKKYYDSGEDEEVWMGEKIDGKNLYYMNNLSGYSFRKHKPFGEYIENSRMFMNDED